MKHKITIFINQSRIFSLNACQFGWIHNNNKKILRIDELYLTILLSCKDVFLIVVLLSQQLIVRFYMKTIASF